MTPEERWDIEIRAEKVLFEWAFENEKGDHTVLLVNVGRCIFKWRRLAERYEGTWIALGGGNTTAEEAFDELSDVEKRGVLAGVSMILRVPTFEEIPPIFDKKMEKWVTELETLRAAATAA